MRSMIRRPSLAKRPRPRAARLLAAAALGASLALFLPSHETAQASAPANRYTVTTLGGVPAVVDALTGLTWKQNEEAGGLQQPSAVAACTGGWRLPTVRELTSIYDETATAAPAIDRTYFFGFSAGSAPYAGYFWTTTQTHATRETSGKSPSAKAA